ncbi:MAG: hypothetical protein ACYCWW_04065 [Deltaproteobacteria bacterium]
MPRRPFTTALIGLHVLGSLGFIGLLGLGIARSVLGGRLAASPPMGPCGDEGQLDCARELRTLRAELQVKLAAVEQASGTDAAGLWDAWAKGWRQRHALVEGRCCLEPERPDGSGRTGQPSPSLLRANQELSDLERLYGTHVVQFAREVGPKIDALARDLPPR